MPSPFCGRKPPGRGPPRTALAADTLVPVASGWTPSRSARRPPFRGRDPGQPLEDVSPSAFLLQLQDFVGPRMSSSTPRPPPTQPAQLSSVRDAKITVCIRREGRVWAL